jgi:hypothetical protein
MWHLFELAPPDWGRLPAFGCQRNSWSLYGAENLPSTRASASSAEKVPTLAVTSNVYCLRRLNLETLVETHLGCAASTQWWLMWVKMATGTYPMGTGHPYLHPPDQNLTRRVTRTRRRVENSFHTRTRRVILTRRVTHTRQYTRVHTPKYNSFQQNKSTIEQQNRNISGGVEWGWGLGVEGVQEYIYSYAYMGQIWAIGLYELKLQMLNIIYVGFFNPQVCGYG